MYSAVYFDSNKCVQCTHEDSDPATPLSASIFIEDLAASRLATLISLRLTLLVHTVLRYVSIWSNYQRYYVLLHTILIVKKLLPLDYE